MILYITQNSFYFVHRYFLTFFLNKKCEVIYVYEKKRGLTRKYREIAFFLGLMNFIKSIFLEFVYFLKLYRRTRFIKSCSISDKDLNNILEFKLKKGIYKEVISIGCPCIINTNLQKKFKVRFLNLHGGIIPFQKGRFSPIKSLNKGHKYLGATLHVISTKFDNGEIISQDFFKIRSRNILNNYKKVLCISSQLLEDFFNGRTKFISKDILKTLK